MVPPSSAPRAYIVIVDEGDDTTTLLASDTAIVGRRGDRILLLEGGMYYNCRARSGNANIRELPPNDPNYIDPVTLCKTPPFGISVHLVALRRDGSVIISDKNSSGSGSTSVNTGDGKFDVTVNGTSGPMQIGDNNFSNGGGTQIGRYNTQYNDFRS